MKLKKIITLTTEKGAKRFTDLRVQARDDGLQYAMARFPDMSVPQAHTLDAYMAGWERCMEQLQEEAAKK